MAEIQETHLDNKRHPKPNPNALRDSLRKMLSLNDLDALKMVYLPQHPPFHFQFFCTDFGYYIKY
jgi:hypothetical protein